jgi:ankyrin repeat protein
MNQQPPAGDSGPLDSPHPGTPPDYDNDEDVFGALDEARAGNSSRLAGIVLSEKNRQCHMAILGDVHDTYRARCLLHLFEEAALNRNLADMKLLVQAEAHEVAHFVEERTRPLHLVAQAAFAPGIRLLLGVGCDQNEMDRFGQTPLRFLMYSDQTHPRQRRRTLAALRALLAGKASPNIADGTGAVPLHWATGLFAPAAVRTLIAAEANVNALDQEGNTPLTALFGDLAVNHPAMVQRKLRLLLDAGADPNLTGVHRTPLELASELNLTEAVLLLRAHGAN